MTENFARERQWTLDEIPLSERFAAWCDILGATHLAFAMDPARDSGGGFDATITEHGLGALSLLDTTVQPHRGRRTRRQVSANTRDVIGLHFITSGRQVVDLAGERVVLGPGDAMIWDGAATGDYEILEPLTKTTLIVPRSVAATTLPSYRNDFVRTLPRDHQPTRDLVRMLSLLGEQLPTMTDGARHASARLVAEMLKPLDRLEGGDPAQSPVPARLELRERVLDYIDRNLGNPLLSPAVVAAAHSVSVRTLYTALEGLGVTPSRYIRDRRLARCYDDLLVGADSVAAISRRHGFTSAGHLSTLFRDRYGAAPSAVRRSSSSKLTISAGSARNM